jgi:PHS family inorganic phosphate transporter-like MFS transporter
VVVARNKTDILAQGQLPGFYIAMLLPDRIGRVRQQFYGSVAATVLYAIWAGVSDSASTGGLLTLFTITQLILQAGPASTTFLLPVELFPTRVRGTAHGIAAASGKCGAVLTAFAFGAMTDKMGLPGALGLFSGVMALAAACTLLIPEPKGKTIEDLEGEALYNGSDLAPTLEDSVALDVASAEGKVSVFPGKSEV